MRQHRKRVFGVALDASDDPWSLQLKWASMMATGNSGDSLHSDPYDALVKDVADLQHFELAGKFPIPSWLGPRPQLSDRHLVNAKNLQQFVANGGLVETMKGVRDFVERNIFPAFPIMVGIDHSTTGGVISALAKRYGPEMISIVVLDRHFDAIPLSLRIDGIVKATSDFETDTYPLLFNVIDEDQYCCGNFWAYLINAGIVLPENLLFVGVADYPSQKIDPKWQSFRESYLGFEERGCSFFPLWKFDGWYIDSLTQFLNDKITTPYVYVSLDLDVGSYRCINAARYMDGPGINKQNILDIVGIIADGSRNGSFMLVGFDIMEFNMHFLGIKTAEGGEDSTLPLVRDFIKTLTLT
jgi:arginase family enzyme